MGEIMHIAYNTETKDLRSKDIVPDYNEYLRLQSTVQVSHEINVERWFNGQRRYVTMNFQHLNRNSRIIDIGCGDGVGLLCLREMGFINLIGIELAHEKAQIAIDNGFIVYKSDMHDLSFIKNQYFDIAYSSHSLEHCWDPAKVISEIKRILVPGGDFFVVLPYPDCETIDTCHLGKFDLGIWRNDEGEFVSSFFIKNGFQLIDKKFDDVRA